MKNMYPSDALVSTAWVAAHLDDTAAVRVIEASGDLLLYEAGHLPEAVKVDTELDLQDDVRRALIGPVQFATLCAMRAITPDTACIFYGDQGNRWACFAFWVFKLFGHEKCFVMDGGRAKWRTEGRPLVQESPAFPKVPCGASRPNPTIRIFREAVLRHVEAAGPLVDVRSPEEYTGMLTNHPTYPQEGVLRGGHIPGARSMPWRRALRSDGTFQPRAVLEEWYLSEGRLDPEAETVVYCRLGDRSSHTWFVLTHLLGFRCVKNYDGSWAEWGNLVEAPIERGSDPWMSEERRRS